ncbi:MAG TPA: carboxypeptidase-like regulatory domain-containing protein [Anaeromyxobacteraceae bacterium]|nr:carboxypeptidase-like regulatory domain-containing protein [Anaeromyxobacteraceae bacterium]
MSRATRRLAGALLVLAPLALAACKGSSGNDGAPGPTGPTGPTGPSGGPGASTGTFTGTVTIAGVTPAVPLTGVAVTITPAPATPVTTDVSGTYSVDLPVGVYTVTWSTNDFTSQTASVSVTAGQLARQDVALVPTTPVVVRLNVIGDAVIGGALDATAAVTPLDGSSVDTASYAWSSTRVGVTFATPAGIASHVQLPTLAGFKATLFKVLDISPLGNVDINPNAANEDGSPFQAGLQDRFQVQAINDFDLESTGAITLAFQVKTTSGTYTGTTTVTVPLPWRVATGQAQVPLGEPVVVHGKKLVAPQTAWAFTLTDPLGADATSLLDDPASQHPVFTPTVKGVYTLTETNSATSIPIGAGAWVGALDAAATLAALDPVTGQGNPVGSSACTACHRPSGFAPDKFTPWSQSGHAQILTQNLNAGDHYAEACFDCHTVGFNTGATNNGVDEQAAYPTMLADLFAGGSPVPNPLNWKKLVTTYPAVAHMSNVQCESCHGPNDVDGHGGGTAAEKARRVTLDAGVCGRCHGEPARHGRYQEWQVSGHANFTVAVAEGFNAAVPPAAPTIRTSCASCHTAQGALLYFAQLQGGNASRTLTAASVTTLQATLTPSTVQPQTCAVCHDPHDPGTNSSIPNDVHPRINGDTPLLPGGFAAIGVGKGAVCIACHNSRNGEAVAGSGIVALHEDGDPTFGTLTAYAAPHEACQGDVLMGRNAYYVQGVRSAHSNIANTCAACHMESVPPPPGLGYPGQTNHTFAANLTICSKCHGAFDGAALQASVVAELAALQHAVEAAIVRVYQPGATVVFLPGRVPQVTINGAAAVNLSTVVPAANTVNTDILAKANWNYSLIHDDFSKGVHNPSFAHDVMFRTTAKVNGITTAQ